MKRIKRTGFVVKRSLIGCSVFVLGLGVSAQAQLPSTCKPPASAAQSPAGTPPARVYNAIGVWFAQKGDSNCAVAAFKHALHLDPRSAEAHFDLGLVLQNQNQTVAAISEFRLALQYDPALSQAHCAIGSSLTEPAEAEIQHLAHRLWLEEGRPEGRELQHWFRAKEHLRHHHGRPASTATRVHFPSHDLPTGPTSPTTHP